MIDACSKMLWLVGQMSSEGMEKGEKKSKWEKQENMRGNEKREELNEDRNMNSLNSCEAVA